jgi:transposase
MADRVDRVSCRRTAGPGLAGGRGNRQRGKSDTADAVAAALAALNGEASGVPKSHDGAAESIRMLKVARAGAVKARTQAGNQLRDLLVTAPQALRQQLAGLPRGQQVEMAARFRPGDLAGPAGRSRLAPVSAAGRPDRRRCAPRQPSPPRTR